METNEEKDEPYWIKVLRKIYKGEATKQNSA